MAKWKVDIYQLDGTGGHSAHYQIEDVLLSGKIKYAVNETNKFTFTVNTNAFGGALANMLPMKSFVTVDRVGTSTRRMFVGLVEKRTLSISECTYTFECMGGLGAQKYMPPYRYFSAGMLVATVADVISNRFRGWADPPYDTYNPSALFANEFDLFAYGAVDWFIVDNNIVFNSSIEQIQKNSATAADFVKNAFLNVENFEGFSEIWGNVFLMEFPTGSIGIVPRATPNVGNTNTQEIRYDKNLISCEITEESYNTIVEITGGNLTEVVQSAEYPFPFGFKDYVLPASSGSYTQNDLQTIGGGILAEPHRVISAAAFDRGILDDGTDFLEIQKYVNVVYLENGVEKTEIMEITSISYDLTNPRQDRVQLGRKIIPLTQRS